VNKFNIMEKKRLKHVDQLQGMGYSGEWGTPKTAADLERRQKAAADKQAKKEADERKAALKAARKHPSKSADAH